MHEVKDRNAVNDHLAIERTYLAWIQTYPEIILFGFVVVKSTLFIKQIPALSVKGETIELRAYFVLLEILISLIGTRTTFHSYIRYKHTKNQLKEGQHIHFSGLIKIFTEFFRSVRSRYYCIPYSKYLI